MGKLNGGQAGKTGQVQQAVKHKLWSPNIPNVLNKLRNQNEQEKNSGNKKIPKHVSGSHVKVSILSEENEKTSAKHARM